MTTYSFINLEDFIHLFLPSFLISIGFLIVFFMIGGVTRSAFFLEFKHKFNTANLFYNLFVGLVVIVFIVSLYKTNFHSINVLFLLVGLGFCYKRKELIKDASKITSRKVNLVFISIIYILLYTVYFSLIYQRDAANPLSNFMADDLFYGLVSYHIYNQGVENSLHVVNYVTESQDIVPTYYHYFELWLTGFLNTIDGQNINQTFSLSTSTLISFIASMGIYFLLDVYFKIEKKYLFLLLFFFIIFSPVYFFFYEEIFGNSLSYHIDNILFGKSYTMNIKFHSLLICFLSLFYFLLSRKFFLVTLLVSVLVIFSVTVAPTLILFTFFLFIYSFRINYKEKWEMLIYNFIFYVAFLSFYYFQETFTTSVIGSVEFPLWKELYFRIRIPLSLTVKHIIVYFPYLVLIFVIAGKEEIIRQKKVIGLYMLSLLSFAFVSSLFYKQINYIQIGHITNTLITYCFFIYMFSFLIKKVEKRKKNILVVFLVVLSFYYLYLGLERVDQTSSVSNIEFNNSFKNLFKEEEKIWGVSIIEIKEVEPYSIISTYSSPFNFLSTIHSGTFAISLSHYGLTHTTKDPIDSMNVEWALQKDPFTIFIQKQKSQNSFVSLNQSRLDFILKYRPKFLVVFREELIPVNFTPYLGKRITNSNNSITIYLLNYEK